MPSTSKKQHNLMAAVAHNPAFAKKVGIPQSVGSDFAQADKGKKFSSGGRADRQVVNKKKTDHGQQTLFNGGGMAKMETGVKKMGPKGISKAGVMPESKKMGMLGMKKGGMPKKMAKGGGIESKGKTKGRVC
jgi:hypothetical protein